MDKYRIKPNNHQKGDIFLSDLEISPLILFCNALFPGCEFKYCATRNGVHELYHFPFGDDDQRQGIEVSLDTNLIHFAVRENNDMAAAPDRWAWNRTFKYHRFLQYRVIAAYKILDGMCVIEHHVVDRILRQPATLQMKEKEVEQYPFETH